MKLLAKLLVCALALAAVTDAAETTRKTCDDGGDVTPLPTTGTPAVTTPAPTTSTPGQTTPAPTTATPGVTTPAPTTTTPVVTTPAPTTATPVVTTSAPTTTAPVVTTPAPVPTTTAPVVTTPAPTTPTKFDKNQEYLRDGIDCAGYLRLPPPGRPITQQDCVLDYKVKFSKADEVPTAGCVVCEAKWGKFVYDASVPLASQEVPLCGKLPLCTRFKDYGMLTALDLMCVLSQNGAAPIDDPKVCGFGDN